MSQQAAILRSFALVVQQLQNPAVLLGLDLGVLASNEGFAKLELNNRNLSLVEGNPKDRPRAQLMPLLSKLPKALLSLDHKLRGQAIQSLPTGRVAMTTQVALRCGPDQEVAVEQTIHPITGGEGEIIGLWVDYRLPRTLSRELLRAEELEREVAKRTAQLSAALEKASRLAVIDPLTNLMNRRAFDEHALTMHDLAERHQRNFALLMCDLDFFKRVNDTYGHAAGDDILVATARALESATRNSDKVARFGGEEFVVLLSETDVASVQHVADRCGACVRAMPVDELVPGSDFHQTISIGIAIYPQHGGTIEQLLEHADQALYAAKSNGRDRSELYSDTMEAGEAAAKPIPSTHSRVLVVEPNQERARMYRATLCSFDVVVVGSAAEALALCERQSFDALVSDEDADDESGIEFLRRSTSFLALAKRILILAKPDAMAAMRATNRAQADHILTRSSAESELSQSIEHCLLRAQLATPDQRHGSSTSSRVNIGGATLDAFYEVLSMERVPIHYAPIVETLSGEVVAMHADTTAPSPYFSKQDSPKILNVAQALESTWELGHLARQSIALDLVSLGDAQIFLPIHPSELANENLYSEHSENLLSQLQDRIVLSFSEDDFIGDSSRLHQRICDLKSLGYGLAIRSIGTGFANLSTLASLQPDYLQLDVSGLCHSSTEATHRRLVECFVGFAHMEGILTIAEGIGKHSDTQYLESLGFSFFMSDGDASSASREIESRINSREIESRIKAANPAA